MPAPVPVQDVPALAGALHDSEPLVRGHAAWALGQIGGDAARRALKDAMEGEADAEVEREIHLALAEFDARDR